MHLFTNINLFIRTELFFFIIRLVMSVVEISIIAVEIQYTYDFFPSTEIEVTVISCKPYSWLFNTETRHDYHLHSQWKDFSPHLCQCCRDQTWKMCPEILENSATTESKLNKEYKYLNTLKIRSCKLTLVLIMSC